MRLSILMTIILSGGIAVGADAQNISFSGKNISLPVFFSVITSQTGYTVFYNNEVISQSHPVTLILQNTSLQDALHEALKDQSLNYKIKGNTIFISVSPSGKTVPDITQEYTEIEQGNVRDNSYKPPQISLRTGFIVQGGESVGANSSVDFCQNKKPGFVAHL